MSDTTTKVHRLETLKAEKTDPEVLELLEDISMQRKEGFAMIVTYEPLPDGKQKRHVGFVVNNMDREDLIDEITSVAAQAITKASAHPEITKSYRK